MFSADEKILFYWTSIESRWLNVQLMIKVSWNNDKFDKVGWNQDRSTKFWTVYLGLFHEILPASTAMDLLTWWPRILHCKSPFPPTPTLLLGIFFSYITKELQQLIIRCDVRSTDVPDDSFSPLNQCQFWVTIISGADWSLPFVHLQRNTGTLACCWFSTLVF